MIKRANHAAKKIGQDPFQMCARQCLFFNNMLMQLLLKFVYAGVTDITGIVCLL